MASGSEEPHVTFNVKSASDAKYTLTLSTATTVGDLKEKLSTEEYANLPVERIRLIYSGRVLKDPDSLDQIKIKDGHTIHLVKGAQSNARQNPANQGGSAVPSGAGSNPTNTSNVPTNIAAGTGNNPLAQLTGARYAGFHNLPGAEMFGPDGGMTANTSDNMLRMLDDPNFLQQMNEAMNNPAVIEMMQNSPMVRNNPMMRQMIQDPNFRRMLTNPDLIRMQLSMQRSMQGGGEGSFPAPGVTDTTPQQPGQQGENQDHTGGQGQGQQPPSGGLNDPFMRMMMGGGLGGGMGGGNAGGNPFAALFNPPGAGAQGTTTAGSQPTSPLEGGNPENASNTGAGGNSAPGSAPGGDANANPFAGLFGGPFGGGAGGDQNSPFAQMAQNMMRDPEAMRAAAQMLGGMGGGMGAGMGGQGAGGENPFAGLFGGMGGQTSQPPDNRPPEERYADQLRQLNDMGFYDFDRNVQALRRSGGSVQGAVEYLLTG